MGIRRRRPDEIVVPRKGKDTDHGPIRVYTDPCLGVSGVGIEYNRKHPKTTLDDEGGRDGTPQA